MPDAITPTSKPDKVDPNRFPNCFSIGATRKAKNRRFHDQMLLPWLGHRHLSNPESRVALHSFWIDKMKYVRRIVVLALAIALAIPTTSLCKPWETDDYGFPIEEPETLAQSSRNRSCCYQPQHFYIRPVCHLHPTQPNVAQVAKEAPLAATNPGFRERVATSNARLMRGHTLLGHIEVGTRVTVLEVRGPWAGIIATVNGQRLNGWVRNINLK